MRQITLLLFALIFTAITPTFAQSKKEKLSALWEQVRDSTYDGAGTWVKHVGVTTDTSFVIYFDSYNSLLSFAIDYRFDSNPNGYSTLEIDSTGEIHYLHIMSAERADLFAQRIVDQVFGKPKKNGWERLDSTLRELSLRIDELETQYSTRTKNFDTLPVLSVGERLDKLFDIYLDSNPDPLYSKLDSLLGAVGFADLVGTFPTISVNVIHVYIKKNRNLDKKEIRIRFILDFESQNKIDFYISKAGVLEKEVFKDGVSKGRFETNETRPVESVVQKIIESRIKK